MPSSYFLIVGVWIGLQKVVTPSPGPPPPPPPPPTVDLKPPSLRYSEDAIPDSEVLDLDDLLAGKLEEPLYAGIARIMATNAQLNGRMKRIRAVSELVAKRGGLAKIVRNKEPGTDIIVHKTYDAVHRRFPQTNMNIFFSEDTCEKVARAARKLQTSILYELQTDISSLDAEMEFEYCKRPRDIWKSKPEREACSEQPNDIAPREGEMPDGLLEEILSRQSERALQRSQSCVGLDTRRPRNDDSKPNFSLFKKLRKSFRSEKLAKELNDVQREEPLRKPLVKGQDYRYPEKPSSPAESTPSNRPWWRSGARAKPGNPSVRVDSDKEGEEATVKSRKDDSGRNSRRSRNNEPPTGRASATPPKQPLWKQFMDRKRTKTVEDKVNMWN